MDENQKELLISHDEIVIFSQIAMNIILHSGLLKKLEKQLKEAGIQPGFAERSEKVQETFKRERLQLMATGEIR